MERKEQKQMYEREKRTKTERERQRAKWSYILQCSIITLSSLQGMLLSLVLALMVGEQPGHTDIHMHATLIYIRTHTHAYLCMRSRLSTHTHHYTQTQECAFTYIRRKICMHYLHIRILVSLHSHKHLYYHVQ